MQFPPIEMPTASANLLRIAGRIQLLEQFYEQVKQTCVGLEDKVQGYNSMMPFYQYGNVDVSKIYLPRNFQETMNEIGIFLKMLRGETLTEIEVRILEFGSGIYQSLTLGYNRRLEFDTLVESIIHWLYNVLNQCRSIKSGIITYQQQYLANLYEPTGSIAQEAQKLYYSTAKKQ